MTIKEIETRSGMTRANIRFYEAEGLLEPSRLENGYRDYSEDDLAALDRIRLLRGLHVPLDEIRALQKGARTLVEVLEWQLPALEREQTQLGRAAELCRALCADGADYATLDAPRYLALLDASPSVPATDAIREQRAPWRRYWARSFDMTLYGSLIFAVAALAFHLFTPVGGVTFAHRILLWALVIAALLLLEPLFLSFLGTTPGKWILGLRVTDPDGRRLTREDAFVRTADVLLFGLGFNVPLVNLYCPIRCLVKCEGSEPLPWEKDSSISVRDMKNWRYIVLGLAFAAVIGLMALALLLSWRMPNRGDLTVAELSENYTRAVKLYHADELYRLEKDGTWARADNTTWFVGLPSEEMAPPALNIEERDGAVTGVSFEGNVPLFDIHSMEACLVCALAGAQKDASLLGNEVYQAMNLLRRSGGSFTTDVCGVHVESRTGYFDVSIPTLTYDSATGTFASEEMNATREHVEFSMQLSE